MTRALFSPTSTIRIGLLMAAVGTSAAFGGVESGRDDAAGSHRLSTRDLESVHLAGEIAAHRSTSEFRAAQERDYGIDIGGLLQFRWIGNFRGDETGRSSVSPDDDSQGGFEFRRVELVFAGTTADPNLTYVVVLATEDGAMGVEQIIAQDVKLAYAFDEHWSISAGRYFAPFLREELIGGGGSLPVALSYMNNELSIGRAEGVSLLYGNENFRGHAMFHDGAGSGGGGGVNNPFADTSDFAISGRLDLKLDGEWDQWGDFTSDGEQGLFFGGAAHFETGETDVRVADEDYTIFAWTADASWESDGWHLFAAVAGEHFDNDQSANMDNIGVVGQVGYRMADSPYEPFARYEAMFFDDTLGYAEDTVSIVTVGVNYHTTSYLKFGADVVWALDP
ncbi:MAG: hypothetical protein KDA28_05375, partial [Phycisphaerales bacterium]|nr:hypothetical protein [Phycisphaerales bacterium]